MFFTKKKYCFLLFIFCVMLSNNIFSQKNNLDTIKLPAWISPEGDTLALSYLPWVQVQSLRILTREQIRKKEEWTRLRNAVYVTYPYAKAASKIMNEINAKLVGVSDRKQRKAIIKFSTLKLVKESKQNCKLLFILFCEVS